MFEILMGLSVNTFIYTISGIIILYFIILRLTEEKWIDKEVYFFNIENLSRAEQNYYNFFHLIDMRPVIGVYFKIIASENKDGGGRIYKSNSINALVDLPLFKEHNKNKKIVLSHHPKNPDNYKLMVKDILN
jgi:hypothetical protein